MISRLVLVGMVAALGVSLPNLTECEIGLHAAREWASAQLADWDTWRPREVDSRRVADAPAPAPREVRPARARRVVVREDTPETGRPAPAPSPSGAAPNGRATAGSMAPGIDPPPHRQAIVFDPIRLDDPPVADLACELNRWAEGLNIQPSTIAATASPPDRVLLPARDSAAWELVIASCRAAEGAGVSERVAAPLGARPQPTRGATPDPIAAFFEENPEGYEPAEEGLAPSVAGGPAASAVRPRFEPIAMLADGPGGIAEELNRFAEGIGNPGEDTAKPIVSSRRFEPIVAMRDAESGTAYELNRASEGLDPVLPRGEDRDRPAPQLLSSRGSSGAVAGSPSLPELAAGPPQPASLADRFPGGGGSADDRAAADSGLGQAIRLTREAASAWLGVLKGPTRVTMTLR